MWMHIVAIRSHSFRTHTLTMTLKEKNTNMMKEKFQPKKKHVHICIDYAWTKLTIDLHDTEMNEEKNVRIFGWIRLSQANKCTVDCGSFASIPFVATELAGINFTISCTGISTLPHRNASESRKKTPVRSNCSEQSNRPLTNFMRLQWFFCAFGWV